jgi:hypothetical protein
MGMALVEERSPDAVAEQASAYARRDIVDNRARRSSPTL